VSAGWGAGGGGGGGGAASGSTAVRATLHLPAGEAAAYLTAATAGSPGSLVSSSVRRLAPRAWQADHYPCLARGQRGLRSDWV